MKDKTGPGNDGTELLPRPCPALTANSVNLQSGNDTPAPPSPPLAAGRAFPGSVRIPGSISRGADKRGSIRPQRQNPEG